MGVFYKIFNLLCLVWVTSEWAACSGQCWFCSCFTPEWIGCCCCVWCCCIGICCPADLKGGKCKKTVDFANKKDVTNHIFVVVAGDGECNYVVLEAFDIGIVAVVAGCIAAVVDDT